VQVSMFALAAGGGGSYTALALPATLSRQLLVPAVIALFFAYVAERSRAGIATLAVATLGLALIHPTYALFVLIPLAGYVAARTLLGVGAAVLIPLAMSSVVVLFEAEERTRAIATLGISTMIGLPLGPIVAGVLLQHFWWGSVFVVNLPDHPADFAIVEPHGLPRLNVLEHLGQRNADARRHQHPVALVAQCRPTWSRLGREQQRLALLQQQALRERRHVHDATGWRPGRGLESERCPGQHVGGALDLGDDQPAVAASHAEVACLSPRILERDGLVRFHRRWRFGVE